MDLDIILVPLAPMGNMICAKAVFVAADLRKHAVAAKTPQALLLERVWGRHSIRSLKRGVIDQGDDVNQARFKTTA